MRLLKDHIVPKWQLYRRIARMRNPLKSARLTMGIMAPWTMWRAPLLRSLIGIRTAQHSEAITVLCLANRLFLYVPSPNLSVGELLIKVDPQATPEMQAVELFREVAYIDQYEVCHTLKPGAIVLDIGANIGSFTLLASKLVGEQGKVIAVEPVPSNVECLRLMCERNKLGNVEVVAAAVGESPGTLTLHIDPHIGGHSAKKEFTTRSVDVPVTTIDALVAERGLSRVDLIKMDVEGMEAEALKGAALTIRTLRPRLAVSAYHLERDSEDLPALVTTMESNYQVSVERLGPGFEWIMFAHAPMCV